MDVSTVGPAVEIILRGIGVWPSSAVILPRLFWVITVAIIQTFQYRFIFSHLAIEDLSELMDGMSTTVAYTLTIIKLFVFWYHCRIFHEILASMRADWRECVLLNEGLQQQTMMSKANISKRTSNFILAVYVVAVIFYLIGVFVNPVFNKKNNNELKSVPRELVLRLELPFDTVDSPVYELVLTVEFLHQATCTVTAGALSSLILALILHLGGQVDILCDILTQFSAKDVESGASKRIIKSIIARHQRIILFSENIETLYSYIAFSQFLSNTLLICCLGFLIVTSIKSIDDLEVTQLSKSVMFYVAIFMEAFIICFAGEYVTAKGELISNVAYELSWYDLKPSESRLLLLMILRSQKKLKITAGKVIDLSLESFTSIIKASVSHMSVLLALY